MAMTRPHIPSNRLRVARAERRITQRDLARQSGVSESRLWKIENGYLDGTPDERAKLARVLRVSDGELFPGG